MSDKPAVHQEQISNLKKIEGQIRGVIRMIEEERYCVDILTQLHAVTGAIETVEDRILEKHLQGCVATSFRKGEAADKDCKIKEVLGLIRKFRR
ncbi:MAG: metal-sensitive transcriptional regulator [Candidatus Omnitrophota bacterium]